MKQKEFNLTSGKDYSLYESFKHLLLDGNHLYIVYEETRDHYINRKIRIVLLTDNFHEEE